jgi:hypothetical protein
VGCEHRAPEEIVMGIDLEQARRRAKELLRAARAGDVDALARMRDDRAPRLADAQRAVAADLGFGSWPELVKQVEAGSDEPNDDERAGVLRVTGLSYMPGRPVRISVRRRERRYDIDDTGGAVAIAGQPPGWREVAERVVNAVGWNVTRDGVVFVQAVEGRDIDALVQRTAEISVAVLDAVLDMETTRWTWQSSIRQPKPERRSPSAKRLPPRPRPC